MKNFILQHGFTIQTTVICIFAVSLCLTLPDPYMKLLPILSILGCIYAEKTDAKTMTERTQIAAHIADINNLWLTLWLIVTKRTPVLCLSILMLALISTTIIPHLMYRYEK